MVGKKLVIALSVAVLGAGLVTSPVHAGKRPNCNRLCRQEVSTCRKTCTGPKKGSCKKDCKKRIVTCCKQQDNTCASCSPSGAFLDGMD